MPIGFWITCTITSVVVGLIGAIVICSLDNFQYGFVSFLKIFVACFACAFSFVLAAGLLLTPKEDTNATAWNGGYCTECGGRMEFCGSAVVGETNRNIHYYYYKCENCGNPIETTILYGARDYVEKPN